MKQNRSLKELNIVKTLFKDKEDHDPICSPKNFLPVHYVTSNKNTSHYDLKTSKHTQSQKNIFTISNHTSIASPKYHVIKRKQDPAVLTPVNKNLSSQEQPKRPRILSKVRHSNFFSDEFKMGKVLGKGRFGNVCLATHNMTGSVYAVKQISLEKVTPKLI